MRETTYIVPVHPSIHPLAELRRIAALTLLGVGTPLVWASRRLDRRRGAARLEHEFGPRAIAHRAGGPLLPAEDALQLVRSAEAASVPIRGVATMFVGDASNDPPLEHLADFTRTHVPDDGGWDAAAEFIQARQEPGLAFDVVLDGSAGANGW